MRQVRASTKLQASPSHDTNRRTRAADDDGLDPSWDRSWSTLDDDCLAEDGAAVADLGTRERAMSRRRQEG
jgi:hypothetical protein